MALKLTMTCGPYDRARALIDGSIKPEDIDLAITVNDDDVERQRQAARGDFDICEFFMGTYIADPAVEKTGLHRHSDLRQAHVPSLIHLHQH
jgi:hypothetical protein